MIFMDKRPKRIYKGNKSKYIFIHDDGVETAIDFKFQGKTKLGNCCERNLFLVYCVVIDLRFSSEMNPLLLSVDSKNLHSVNN